MGEEVREVGGRAERSLADAREEILALSAHTVKPFSRELEKSEQYSKTATQPACSIPRGVGET